MIVKSIFLSIMNFGLVELWAEASVIQVKLVQVSCSALSAVTRAVAGADLFVMRWLNVHLERLHQR